MGMSASQMRYIMISGKKNDIEFQGQQINQQRTTLATESSALNSSLLNMNVPTPPSSNDYTKVSYTFQTNGTQGTVKSLLFNGSTTDDNHLAGHYTLKYSIPVSGPVPKYAANAIIRPDFKDEVGADGNTTGNRIADGYSVYRNGQYEKLQKVSDEPNETILQDDKSNINRMTIGTEDVQGINTLVGSDNKPLTYDHFYKMTVDGTTRYIADKDLAKASTEGVSIDVPTYFVDQNSTYEKTSEIYNCQNPKYSTSGRLESIDDSVGNTFDFTVASEVDQDAYNDAYNEYLYQKEVYEQSLNEINAKLEVIQAQDKKLELKLSDLDTQQQAIQTEMDAVKKVIDKNIETTFKTFG